MGSNPAIQSGGDGGGTVLVVEDDRPTRELLGTILANEGIACHLTSNGHEAMRSIQEDTPAMVILDLHLPSVQGEAVGAAMRIEVGRALPILVISASLEQTAAERIGAYAFLGKPFELDDFVRLVRQGLGLAARSDSLQRHSRQARERLQQAMERQRATFEATLERQRTGTSTTPSPNAAAH